MTLWQQNYESKLISLTDSTKLIKSEDTVWAGGLLGTPVLFLLELEKRAEEVKNCELYTGLITHPYGFLKPEFRSSFKHMSLFMGPLERKMQKIGNVETINFHFSHFPQLFNHIQPNVMVVEMTPPNEDGYMSMGACGGVGNAEAMKYADTIIAVINNQQPFIGGEENLVHIDQVTHITEGHHPVAGPKGGEPSELEKTIASHVIPYVKDGMTIQIGIGTISNAMGMALKGHKGLGIHTEMFTESMMELCKAGAVSGDNKNYKPNKIITAFTAGSQDLIDYVHNNPEIEMGNVSTVVNPYEIAKNDNFVSLNTCIMADLTGQVASEGVGFNQISGSGGQVDFIRGAQMSKGGISILCLASTHKGKDGLESTIRVALPAGTPVTTPRNDVQIIATEYGSADLRGLSVPQRVEALIDIAHPDFRDALRDEATSAGLCK
ncbi:acetyl-CoA hydrolase/transferase family protein [Photobacterium minamisatsumaniensis]|uniref:acetyl-CoA hydrolase/transferase family protein n=1 Tax=Photobacterium minamisatsumaniensis TaxID=2910233 RepID=UPI003D0F6BB0